MSGDLLEFPAPDDLAIEPEPDLALEIEPEVSIEPEAAAVVASTAIVSRALVEILPADFPLPLLAKFIPNPALRKVSDEAAAYALSLAVEGAEGIQSADVALSTLRTSLKAIGEHFDEPTKIAYDLHKRLTGIRGEWMSTGDAAVKTVGQRIYTEQKRLEQIALEARRKAQAEADQRARDEARRAADEAAKNAAPAPVVEEMKRQAATATAPPVQSTAPAPTMRGSTTVTTWKARLTGTPSHLEPNPDMADLTDEQRLAVFSLMRAILEGQAPLTFLTLNWSAINGRARAEKSAFRVAGIEAYEEGSIRSKGSRTR